MWRSSAARQLPQRWVPAGSRRAHCGQRASGGAWCASQAGQTGWAGQLPHTWQVPGNRCTSRDKGALLNMGANILGGDRAAPVHPSLPPLNTEPENSSAVPGLDARAALRWQRLPRHQSPWLHEEVATRMAGRLQWFRDPPASWLHWEPVDGGVLAHKHLREQFPKAVCHIESRQIGQALQATHEPARRSWNPAQWRRAVTAPAATDETRVAMVWANMALHHEPQPLQVLKSWHDRIQTGGFLMFSCLGPDTLRELRAVYAQAGWPDPAHAYTDMHDWGDMLVHSGFAEPVMDMERITLSYSGALPLLQELRGLGRNLSATRFAGLRSRHWHTRLCQAIEEGLPRSDDGRLLLTFEVIYGHAFKPVPRMPLGPSQSVSVDDMRAMLRAGRAGRPT